MKKIFKGFALGLIVLAIWSSYTDIQERKDIQAKSQIEFVEKHGILSVMF